MDFPNEILNRCKHLILLSILMLLGGCAGQVNMNQVLQANTQVTSNQGIVVARFINASSYPLPFTQLTIVPEDVNKSKDIKPERLLAMPNDESSTAIFASPIKAGEYALSSVRAFHINGDYIYSRFVGTDDQFGLFSVKPGQVTDLGTIIYYQKPQGDKYLNVMLRTNESSPGAILQTHFPFYQYDKNNVLGWDEDGKSEEREDLLVSVAQNPITFSKRYLAPDNTIYLLGQLGIIVKRSPDSEYELDAVDTNLGLNSIVKSESGALATGGKEGKVFLKLAGHDDWQDISLDPQKEIEEILFYQDQYLDVIVKAGKEVQIYRADINANDIKFNLLNKFNVRSGWDKSDVASLGASNNSKQKPQRISGIDILNNDGAMAIKVSHKRNTNFNAFGSSDEITFRFDPANWQVQNKIEDSDIDFELVTGHAKLGIEKSSYWSWTGLPTYWKFDEQNNSRHEIKTKIFRCADGQLKTSKGCNPVAEGKDKKKAGKMENFRLTALPWFMDNLNALAIVSFSDRSFWSGEVTRETKILRTSDGGKSWIDSTNELPKEYCSSILSEVKDRFVVYCAGATSDFYESDDEGKTWIHQRQQDDF